jgi:hypothetical protein
MLKELYTMLTLRLWNQNKFPEIELIPVSFCNEEIIRTGIIYGCKMRAGR